jgi:anti-anti-sigma regulatory factor
MSLHVIAHPWEVEQFRDRVLVKIRPRDLGAETLSVLIDDLVQLAQENGHNKLQLDFQYIQLVTSVVVGKLVSLDRRLRAFGVRLELINLNPVLREVFAAVSWPHSESEHISEGSNHERDNR